MCCLGLSAPPLCVLGGMWQVGGARFANLPLCYLIPHGAGTAVLAGRLYTRLCCCYQAPWRCERWLPRVEEGAGFTGAHAAAAAPLSLHQAAMWGLHPTPLPLLCFLAPSLSQGRGPWLQAPSLFRPWSCRPPPPIPHPRVFQYARLWIYRCVELSGSSCVEHRSLCCVTDI